MHQEKSEAIQQLFNWRNDKRGSPDEALFELMQRASPWDFCKLIAPFPVHATVYAEWLQYEEDSYFTINGISLERAE